MHTKSFNTFLKKGAVPCGSNSTSSRNVPNVIKPKYLIQMSIQ